MRHLLLSVVGGIFINLGILMLPITDGRGHSPSLAEFLARPGVVISTAVYPAIMDGGAGVADWIVIPINIIFYSMLIYILLRVCRQPVRLS